jgi:hypothetical protein
MFDPKVIEKIHPDYWRNTQLSVARFYGAAVIQGTKYVLDPETDHLVREDIYKKELKDTFKQKRVAAAEKKKWTEGLQADLFGAG